jgi:hypothetical protein
VRYYEAIMSLTLGEFATAAKRAEESMALGRAAGEEWVVATAQMSLGGALIGLGEVARGPPGAGSNRRSPTRSTPRRWTPRWAPATPPQSPWTKPRWWRC